MSSWKDPNIAQRCKAAEYITAPFARRLIQQVGLLEVDSGPLIVLDNACGTGIVSVKLYEMLDENAKERLQLVCGDFSESMVQSTQQRITDSGWSGAKAQMVDAQATGLADASFTHVLTNFGIMLMPDATAAINECFRILKSGGRCGISTWDTIGWLPSVRDAIATIPGAPSFPDDETFLTSMGDGKPWNRAEYVKENLQALGFEDIKVEVMREASLIDNATAFAEQFSTILAQFTSKFWSTEECDRCGGEVKPALVKYMSEKYPDDQPFELTMVAILASGRKP